MNLILLLLLSLSSCARSNECHIFVDVDAAIKAGEDCESIAYCSDGIIDESVLKHCLSEKEKQKHK